MFLSVLLELWNQAKLPVYGANKRVLNPANSLHQAAIINDLTTYFN
jgi:hypothetical protein